MHPICYQIINCSFSEYRGFQLENMLFIVSFLVRAEYKDTTSINSGIVGFFKVDQVIVVFLFKKFMTT